MLSGFVSGVKRTLPFFMPLRSLCVSFGITGYLIYKLPISGMPQFNMTSINVYAFKLIMCVCVCILCDYYIVFLFTQRRPGRSQVSALYYRIAGNFHGCKFSLFGSQSPQQKFSRF